MKNVINSVTVLTIAILLSVYPLSATRIVVDQGGNGDYYDIATAYSASSNGDTIFLNAGLYLDFGININHVIHFVGIDRNSVNWTQTNFPLLTSSVRITLTEMTITENYIESNSGEITVKHCVFNEAYIKNNNTNDSKTFINTRIIGGRYLSNTNSSYYRPNVTILNCLLQNIDSPSRVGDLIIKNSIAINCSYLYPSNNDNTDITYSLVFLLISFSSVVFC